MKGHFKKPYEDTTPRGLPGRADIEELYVYLSDNPHRWLAIELSELGTATAASPVAGILGSGNDFKSREILTRVEDRTLYIKWVRPPRFSERDLEHEDQVYEDGLCDCQCEGTYELSPMAEDEGFIGGKERVGTNKAALIAAEEQLALAQQAKAGRSETRLEAKERLLALEKSG